MALATRLRHQVSMHADWDRDETRIAAHYAVEGTDKVLVLTTWISPEVEIDEDVVAALLERLDWQAQEDAARPDDFLTAQLVCS